MPAANLRGCVAFACTLYIMIAMVVFGHERHDGFSIWHVIHSLLLKCLAVKAMLSIRKLTKLS